MITQMVRLDFPCTPQGFRECAEALEKFPSHKVSFGTIGDSVVLELIPKEGRQ